MSDDATPYWKNVAVSIGVPADALAFTYDTFDYIRRQQAPDHRGFLEPGSRQHVTAVEFSAAFVQLAKETFGDDYAAALNSWGLETSEKLGTTVFALVDRNLIGKQDSDRQNEFDGHFDFSSSIPIAQLDRPYSYTSKNWPEGPFGPSRTGRYDLGRVVALIVVAVGIVVIAESVSAYTKPVPSILIVYGVWIGIMVTRGWVQRPPRYSFRAMMTFMTIVALILGLVKWLGG